MTAVIGVLNKAAVAIAADSAVTIPSPNGGRKVLNNANKIFNISRRHPVGLAIYNNADFMGIPWEVIIKEYRRLQIKSFSRLYDYKDDFINFLLTQANIPRSTNDDNNLVRMCHNFFQSHIQILLNNIRLSGNQVSAETLGEAIEQLLMSLSVKEVDENEKIVAFKEYTYEEFRKKYETQLSSIIGQNSIFGYIPKLRPEVVEKIKFKIYSDIVTGVDLKNQYTGLVFAGYGDDELLPYIHSINVSDYFDGRLPYTNFDTNYNNQNGHVYGVYSYAQKDVIETILKGIEPNYEKQINQNLKQSFYDYHNEIVKTIANAVAPIVPNIGEIMSQINIDNFLNRIISTNKGYQQIQFINPLLSAINNLSKEDLSEMAESFIHLTYLKRRITSSEESVGGPVDVAIISKGDGFVWMKRKHYFSAELNPTYFKNNFH